MKRLFLVLLLSIAAVACTTEELPEKKDNSSTIPVDDAVATLNNALSVIRPQTKSGEGPVIDEIISVAKNMVLDGASNEDLAYVVNFAGNEGLAILAADRSLPDPIIAIIDNGWMDQDLKYHTPQTKGDSSQDTTRSSFIEKLIKDYLLREGGGGGDDDDEEHPDDIYPEDPGDPWYPSPEGYWTIYSAIDPMIPLLWDQDYPFNECYPIYTEPDCHRLAGCVPVALAMIIAYLRPNNYMINGQAANWDGINQVYPVGYGPNPGFVWFDYVAEFIYQVGLGCDMSYVPLSRYTFAWPVDAKDYLQEIGFTNATNHLSYSLDLIVDMLEDSKPVFIAAISAFAQGHAWIIDGMIRLQHDTERRNLLHCNMGWRGIANGYYASKVFDSSYQIYCDTNYGDQTPDAQHTFNYHGPFRIITY